MNENLETRQEEAEDISRLTAASPLLFYLLAFMLISFGVDAGTVACGLAASLAFASRKALGGRRK